MPTPQPAPVPPEVADQEAPKRGALTSGTSTKLEPPSGSDTGTLGPGSVIADRYRVDRLLGEGGMGKVYAAEHIHMRKQVAVKVLHREMSTTPEIVARFEREAVAAGKIAHPNVAAATDFGRLDNGSFFLVLEYVAGHDLRSVIKKGAVEPPRALHIIEQIVLAVGAAHAAGVVHRDLKPENIMLVERDGDPDFVKVLDFGIAKIETVGIADPSSNTLIPAAGDAQPLTRMGAVFGTPDYMSPEQALGQPIDGRADLYAVGIMLYELLTGDRPFKGGAVTLMRKHVLEEAPPLPAAIYETVDPRLSAIILKLMQKSAADRYATAVELAGALNELFMTQPPAHGAPLTTAPGADALDDYPSEPSRAERLAPRRSRGGLWFLLLVIIGVGGFSYVTATSPLALWSFVSAKIPVAPTAPVASGPQSSTGVPAASASSFVTASPGGAAASASVGSAGASAVVDPSASSASASPDPAASNEGTDIDTEFPDDTPVASSSALASGGAPLSSPPPPAPVYVAPLPPHGQVNHANPTRPARPRKPPKRHRSGSGGIHIPPVREWFR
jgi:serine/threonine protein kinase